MHVFMARVLAASAPNISPDLTFPGSEWIVKLVGVVMGLIALGFVLLFFNGLFKTVRSVGGHHESTGGGTGLMVASALGLVVVLTGTAFLNRWLNFFG